MGAGTLSAPESRIGVVMTALPKVDTEFPGAGCLLCYAAASAANSSLTSHAHTLTADDLADLKGRVVDLIAKKGGKAIAIADDLKLDQLESSSGTGPNKARKDFTPLKAKYQVDKLVVLQVNTLGFTRPYSSYIPNSDPKAALIGAGYIVNLSNNTYEWYQPIDVRKSSDGKWDEPPKFPGLTNAYFQTIEIGKDNFLKAFQ